MPRIPHPLGKPFAIRTKRGNVQQSFASRTADEARERYADFYVTNWPALYAWGVRVIDCRTGEAIEEVTE